ncbi:MAG: hypothetical protein CM15mP45_10520 [Deltaproteobacteria bacterium]|nr:MAG: hypothetical protein CM15mP45_10520 [Deltaproteobacteria bacterium]
MLFWLVMKPQLLWGVNVKLYRQVAFLICVFCYSEFFALSGVIGFVGLMVPHLARGLVGPLHVAF